MAGGWKRLHNQEFHKLYASQNIIRVIKSGGWYGTCSTHRRDEKFTQIFGQKTWREYTICM